MIIQVKGFEINVTKAAIIVLLFLAGKLSLQLAFKLMGWKFRPCKVAKAFFRKRVRVLCEDREADYSIAFRNFAETDLSYNVVYVSSPPKTNKYILLFKVKSRIPEDLQHVLQKLYSKGERLDGRTLVVPMHYLEGEMPYAVANFIPNPHAPVSYLMLANTFYQGSYIFRCLENDEARKLILQQGINFCPTCFSESSWKFLHSLTSA